MARRRHLSPYRIMWVYVMFDLPVRTKRERKEATVFRKKLLDRGFEMSQYSVYLKYCPSIEKAESIGVVVQKDIPRGGKVDILVISDKQFANMKRFYAREELKTDEKPRQLHLF